MAAQRFGGSAAQRLSDGGVDCDGDCGVLWAVSQT